MTGIPGPRSAVWTRGEKNIAFIEKYCRAPEGEHVGDLLVLEEFQKRWIVEVYDNPYGTHTALLSTAKKNGKTALIGALLLTHIAGPEAVQNSQIVSGAQSREQAGIIFDLASQMILLDPHLRKRVLIKPSLKRLIGIARNVKYKALANEGKTTHGLSPIVVILDELGQVAGPEDKFVSALTTAQGAYSNPLLIAISTQAENDADLLSVWIDAQRAAPDPRVVCHVYEAPEDCQLDDRAAWAAANPALGKFRSLDDVEKQVKRAMQIPANEPTVRNLILNQRVATVAPFVTRSIWESNGAPPAPIDRKKVWAGLDLSSVADLTALVAVAEDGGVYLTAWLPKEGLREKAKKDRVPWDIWEKQGLLNTTPGKAIEYEHVAEYLRGFFDRCDVQALGFDRALMKFLKPWLVKAEFTDAELAKFIDFGQGYLSMTPALRELEVKLTNGQLRHGNNPILNMCAANVKVVGEGGARKFDKQRSRGRIDGMVSLAMAVGVMPQEAEAPPPAPPRARWV